MSDELFVGGVESRKLKRKIEETSSNDVVDTRLSLSLSLGHDEMAKESSSKSISKSLVTPKQQFCCKFCDKKFSTCQALGGHQNAHKEERMLSRMDKEFDARTFGLNPHMWRPYSTMAHHHPFRGPMPHYYGSNMHPVANMSTMPWSNFVPGYGNQSVQNTSILGQRLDMATPYGAATETPQNIYTRHVGFGSEHNQVPSLNVPDRATMGNVVRSGLLGNQYTENQQLSSGVLDLSLNL